MGLEQVRIGVGLTGSFCTFGFVEQALTKLADGTINGKKPIYTFVLSYHAQQLTNRFCTPEELEARLQKLTPHPVIKTIPEAEPLGPNHALDVFAIAPCTGNTLAKLANGVTDTPDPQINSARSKALYLLGTLYNTSAETSSKIFGCAVKDSHRKPCGARSLSLPNYSRT